MAFTLVSSNETGGGSATTTLPSLTAGNLVVVCLNNNTPSPNSAPTDTAGNTYLSVGSVQPTYNASGSAIGIWYTASCIGIGSTNTFTNPNTNPESITAMQWSGALSSSPIDGGSGSGFSATANNSIGGTGTTNNLTAPNLITNFADLVITFSGAATGPQSAGTNIAWIPIQNVNGFSQYFIQSSAGTISPTASDGTASDPYAMVAVAFRAASLSNIYAIPLLGAGPA